MLNTLRTLGDRLKERFSGADIILVLTAALSFRRDASFVEITVAPQAAPGQTLPAELSELTQKRELPLSAFKNADGYTLPAELLALVRQHLDLLDQLGNVPVLWLRLCRPYGFLGLIPWEGQLLAGLQRPVLRLPDFPARPAERTDTLENVIIVDPPGNATSSDYVRLRLANLCSAIFAGSSRTDTHIHVFCNHHWHTRLKDMALDSRIQLADPSARKPADKQRPLYGLPLWTDWILDQLDGRGIDAVHLIGRAAMDDVEAYYVISGTPFTASGTVPDLEIDLESVALLLNRAGAWSISLTPAAAQFRDGLAYLADALAHCWPGSVLFTGHHALAESDAIHAAAKLLYHVHARIPPRFSDGFLYCNPTFIDEKQRMHYASLVPLLTEQAVLLAARAPAAERALSWVTKALPGIDQVNQSTPPAWLGSTQRFFESEVFNDVRRSAQDILMSHRAEISSISQSGLKLTSEASKVLGQIRDVVDHYRDQPSKEDDHAGPHSDS